MKTIYTTGVFDLFHYGHVRMLKKCEEIAFNMQHRLHEKIRLLIGIHSDEACKDYKRQPIMNINERSTSVIELIEWLGRRGVFVAILLDAPIVETREFYEENEIVKTIHAHSEEEHDKYKYMYQDALEMGIFHRLDYTSDISTTELINRCIESTYEKV